MSIYQFHVKDIHNLTRHLSEYKGKVLLIINTATKCGLASQYDELEVLYKKYRSQGLVILNFPSNEFGQNVQNNLETLDFLAENHRTTFPIFTKVEINGENTHPLYAYLKAQQPTDITNQKHQLLLELIEEIGQTRTGSDIKWNFTKFLVDRQGNVTHRFAPTISAKEMMPYIEKALGIEYDKQK